MTSEPIIRQLEQKSGLKSVSAAEPQVLFRQWSEKTYSLDDEGFVYSLNLAGMGLTDGDLASVWQMDLLRLVVLNLNENQLTSVRIPANLPRLKYLSLNENKKLTHLSFENGLPALEKLEVNLCQLEKFALSKGFDSLTWLDLSRNKTLAECTFEGDCPALESLDLSGNGLQKMDLSQGFQNLRYLYINENQFVSPPLLPYNPRPDFKARLETLHLKDNKLEHLPEHLLNYRALESLYLEGNPLPGVPPELIKTDQYASANSWQGIRNYLRSLAEDINVRNDEVKLILLGNSTSGKSSLLRYLRERIYDEKSLYSTHGILNVVWTPENKDFKVNVWDFGGQEFYHATHRLFLSKNAVALVMFDKKTNTQDTINTFIRIYDKGEPEEKEMPLEHFPYQYWFDNLRYFCQEIPANCLIQSKMDDGDKSLVSISDKDKEVYHLAEEHIFRISVKGTSEGERSFSRKFEDFEEGLTALLENNLGKYNISDKWLEIKNKIRELPEDQSVFSKTDFVDFCEKIRPKISEVREGETSSMLDELMDYLHNIGVILYYPDIEKLKETVFVRPQWVTETIYKVLDYSVWRNDGKFSKTHIQEVVPDFDAEKIISLMKEFELIFSMKNDSDTFVAPQYLPVENKEADGNAYRKLANKCKTHLFTLRYPHFLPRSVMTRFICRYGNLTEDNYWKKGILFEIEGKCVLVESDGKEKIRLTGEPGAEVYIGEFFQNLFKISHSNPDLQLSIDENQFVKIETLQNHSMENPMIATVEGEWISVEGFEAFLLREGHFTFKTKYEKSTDKSTINMNSIEQLVTQERLNEAIQLLSQHLPSYQKNDAILLQSRLNGLESSERLGTINNENANLERNRIKHSILQLAEKLNLPEAAKDNFIEKEPVKPTPVPQPPQTGPSKILFLAANPSDESHLQTDQEHRILKAEMERGRGRDKYSFLPPQFAVTITELLRALNDKPQIVHFAGHGERKGIYITKDNNDSQLLPEEAAKRLFKTLKGHTEMVILNACYSASQAKTISEFGMYVVGNNIDVKDNAAISFTKGLYTGLGEGKSFEEAINDALIVVLTENAAAASHIEVWKDGKKLDL